MTSTSAPTASSDSAPTGNRFLRPIRPRLSQPTFTRARVTSTPSNGSAERHDVPLIPIAVGAHVIEVGHAVLCRWPPSARRRGVTGALDSRGFGVLNLG